MTAFIRSKWEKVERKENDNKWLLVGENLPINIDLVTWIQLLEPDQLALGENWKVPEWRVYFGGINRYWVYAGDVEALDEYRAIINRFGVTIYTGEP